MKKRGWAEGVAALGVIVSLVFVGVEVRQNTAVARGQARHELAAANQEFLLALALDEEWSDLWIKAWHSEEEVEEELEEELTENEQMRSRMGMIVRLRNLENVFFQYREGLVPESALQSYGWAPQDFEGAHFREWWTGTMRPRVDPDFVRLFENRMGLAVEDAP